MVACVSTFDTIGGISQGPVLVVAGCVHNVVAEDVGVGDDRRHGPQERRFPQPLPTETNHRTMTCRRAVGSEDQGRRVQPGVLRLIPGEEQNDGWQRPARARTGVIRVILSRGLLVEAADELVEQAARSG